MFKSSSWNGCLFKESHGCHVPHCCIVMGATYHFMTLRMNHPP